MDRWPADGQVKVANRLAEASGFHFMLAVMIVARESRRAKAARKSLDSGCSTDGLVYWSKQGWCSLAAPGSPATSAAVVVIGPAAAAADDDD